jgi:hypothetical protein
LCLKPSRNRSPSESPSYPSDRFARRFPITFKRAGTNAIRKFVFKRLDHAEKRHARMTFVVGALRGSIIRTTVEKFVQAAVSPVSSVALCARPGCAGQRPSIRKTSQGAWGGNGAAAAGVSRISAELTGLRASISRISAGVNRREVADQVDELPRGVVVRRVVPAPGRHAGPPDAVLDHGEQLAVRKVLSLGPGHVGRFGIEVAADPGLAAAVVAVAEGAVVGEVRAGLREHLWR